MSVLAKFKAAAAKVAEDAAKGDEKSAKSDMSKLLGMINNETPEEEKSM